MNHSFFSRTMPWILDHYSCMLPPLLYFSVFPFTLLVPSSHLFFIDDHSFVSLSVFCYSPSRKILIKIKIKQQQYHLWTNNQSLEELVAHENIIKIITNLIDSDNLPHLLLYGPPGTGKTRYVCHILHTNSFAWRCVSKQKRTNHQSPFILVSGAYSFWPSFLYGVLNHIIIIKYLVCVCVARLWRPRNGCTDRPSIIRWP